jgi:hypothetical protein
MARFNPARDFAPRVFSSVAGWGSVPFAVNGHGWLTVYILAPLLGGILGGGVCRFFFKPDFVGSEQDRYRSCGGLAAFRKGASMRNWH